MPLIEEPDRSSPVLLTANVTVEENFALDGEIRRILASKGLELVSEEVDQIDGGLVRWTVVAKEVEHRFGQSDRCVGCHMELTYYERAIEILMGWPSDSEKEARIAEVRKCKR